MADDDAVVDRLVAGVISKVRAGEDVEAIIAYLLHEPDVDLHLIRTVALRCEGQCEPHAGRVVMNAVGTGVFDLRAEARRTDGARAIRPGDDP
jgi:hypothetical protein